jgi:spore photoproduct lyase
LKHTYRTMFPYITVKTQYDLIKKQLKKRLTGAKQPVIFNSGELADSLAMEHLTGAGKEFIPWFGASDKGHLFMLTKSDNVDGILDLKHNGHTVIAWSMNNDKVSRKYEIGAPTFKKRLSASEKVQNAGYPIRVRLDPIVPFEGWQGAYAETSQQIFDKVVPERITIGTLRFEKEFYVNREHLFNTGSELPDMLLNLMEPMFEPKILPGKKMPQIGKYSFPEEKRIEIFRYVIDEIRKYSDCKIALCKESAEVWEETGLNASECSCACQLNYADMLKPKEESKEGVLMTEAEPVKLDIETIPDPLVEKAYAKLASIFSKNYEQALMEAGQYIVRTFYAGEEAVEGYHFYFHFTLTPYGQDIEGAVLPSKDELIQTFIQLSKKIGKEKVIWRYDPILLTDKIDIDFHKTEFLKLAESLQGYTDKCVISFIDTGYCQPKSKSN